MDCFYQLCDSVKADITEGEALFNGTIELAAYKEAADMLELAANIARGLTEKPPPRGDRFSSVDVLWTVRRNEGVRF